MLLCGLQCSGLLLHAVPWLDLYSVIVEFPDHTHLFWRFAIAKRLILYHSIKIPSVPVPTDYRLLPEILDNSVIVDPESLAKEPIPAKAISPEHKLTNRLIPQ